MATVNDFPEPNRVGGANKWAPADLHQWEARYHIDGLPELTGLAGIATVANRYGVCTQTIWRWLRQSRDARAAADRQVG